MQRIWNRIEHWLTEHAPSLLEQLRPGATDEDTQQIAPAMGTNPPEDFLASLRIHNGAPTLSIDGWQFCAIEGMLGTRQWMNELFPDDEDWWPRSWLPFAYNGSADLLCVNLCPSSETRRGLREGIVLFRHYYDPAEWLAPSFQSFFSAFADHLEAGKYQVKLLNDTLYLESDALLLYQPVAGYDGFQDL